jgi:hypothetical protein
VGQGTVRQQRQNSETSLSIYKSRGQHGSTLRYAMRLAMEVATTGMCNGCSRVAGNRTWLAVMVGPQWHARTGPTAGNRVAQTAGALHKTGSVQPAGA